MPAEIKRYIHWATIFLLSAGISRAAVHYVDAAGANPAPPFLTWGTAATNIQDAIDASVAGDQVIVTNGVYDSGSRVANPGAARVVLDKAITVQSVNGAQSTLIAASSSLICAYLTNNSRLSGFALSNGHSGVICNDASAVVANCLIVSNSYVSSFGNGVGAFGGTLTNCTLMGNYASYVSGAGGGAQYATLNNCTLVGNWIAPNGSGSVIYGGGADHCTLNYCVLTGNRAEGPARPGFPVTTAGYGGAASYSTLNNCTLIGNRATSGGGLYSCSATNCLIYSSIGSGALSSTLYNSTVVSNDYGVTSCSATNCIIYFNSVANYQGSDLAFAYSCTTPAVAGTGNISSDPLFVNLALMDLRLQSDSPCINAGLNSYVTTSADLDGSPRIVNGTVDMGVYEYQGVSGTTGFQAWLQQYGLPTDGSANYTDPDGDGMNNWQEWQANTNPTNAASALRLMSAKPSGGTVTITWQSALGVSYFVQRASAFGSPTPFVTIATNVPGQNPMTTFVDTGAESGGALYYRVGVP